MTVVFVGYACPCSRVIILQLALTCLHVLQNVVPEKLFSRERAVKQLLEIIDSTTIETNGKFFAWDKQEVPW